MDRFARPGRRPASTATRRGPDRISRYRLPLFFIVIRPGIGPFEGFLLLHRVLEQDAGEEGTGRIAGRQRDLAGRRHARRPAVDRSEEHTSELQSRLHLVCRLLLEKKKKSKIANNTS